MRRLAVAAVAAGTLLWTTPATAGTTAGAEPGSVPDVAWHACTDLPPGSPPLDCATYDVPLDYAHPGRGTVHLALDRFRATGHRTGSLFLNPGGPGGSGVSFVAELAPYLPALTQHFDLVGLDPRGVGASTPSIRCEPVQATVARLDAARAHPLDPRQAVAEAKAFDASCVAQSGDLLPYMGTGYVARDLDRVRAAVGDERLTYLGLSYGSYLGAVYADMFPGRVRAVTLDGSLDPFLYGQDFLGLLTQNYRASQASVRAFLDWCSSSPAACGFGQGHAWEALARLVDRLDAHPLTGSRGVTNGYTVADLLYVQTTGGRAAWTQTGALLGALDAGTQVVSNRDLVDRSTGMNVVIECTDSAGGADVAAFRSFAWRAPDLAHTLGPALVSGPPSYDGANGAACAQWPVSHPPSDWDGDFRARGSAPVLVVGSEGDPSTPYAGAVSLSQTLQHGRLLTERSGPDSTHTSYFFNSCIRAKVDAYLLHGTLPPVGDSCAEEEPPPGGQTGAAAGLLRQWTLAG